MWKETLLTALANLIKVKSIVTFLLSAVFAVLALRGVIEPKDILTVYLIIVSFYFGTQNGKAEARNELDNTNH